MSLDFSSLWLQRISHHQLYSDMLGKEFQTFSECSPLPPLPSMSESLRKLLAITPGRCTWIPTLAALLATPGFLQIVFLPLFGVTLRLSTASKRVARGIICCVCDALLGDSLKYWVAVGRGEEQQGLWALGYKDDEAGVFSFLSPSTDTQGGFH